MVSRGFRPEDMKTPGGEGRGGGRGAGDWKSNDAPPHSRGLEEALGYDRVLAQKRAVFTSSSFSFIQRKMSLRIVSAFFCGAQALKSLMGLKSVI